MKIGNVAALTYYPEDTISTYDGSPNYHGHQMRYLRSDSSIRLAYTMDTAYWKYTFRPIVTRVGPFRSLKDALGR